MKFFSRKKQNVSEEAEIQEDSQKEELESELEKIEENIRQKNQQLKGITSKLADVKKEYDVAVSALMTVKKESNEKKNHIESLERQQRVSKSKAIEAQRQYDHEKIKINEVQKTRASLEQTKKDIELGKKNHLKIQGEITEAQTRLNDINVKRIDAENKYQEILAKIDGADIKEKPDVKTLTEKVPKNVVEAASAVVASMKTRLNIAQKELEVVKRLLEKERIEHQKTKDMLKSEK